MTARTCNIEGCDNPHQARGWCDKHYARWHRHGDPEHLEVEITSAMSPEDRFWAQVDRGSPTDCWLWSGAVHGNGYAYIRVDGERPVAHRYAYELLIGPIPEGMTLDHLCRVRHCVNPRHLEPVTFEENVQRGMSPSALNVAKTHCKRGHPLSGDNLYINPAHGGRVCKKCTAMYQREYYARNH